MNAKDIEKATSSNGNEMRKEVIGQNGDFTLLGYSSSDAMNEFFSGTYTMTNGSISENFTSNECLINEELATLNGISVGDSITFVNPNDSTKTITLKVTGIFKDNDESDDNKMNLFSKSANTILTNTSVIDTFVLQDDTLNVSVNPTFYLTSNEDIEKFQSELTEKGLSDSYALSTNLDEADESLSGISNLKSFSVTFLIITLLIGAIILIVLNMINVRERKYEIGVLRTIGMKKTTVAMQFLSELLIISFVSFVIGLGIGSLISVPTANKLLEQEIAKSTEQINQVNQNFGGNIGGEIKKGNNLMGRGIANVTKVDSIEAVVNGTIILELLGVGILLTIISSVASSITIMRFSPLSILKERS